MGLLLKHDIVQLPKKLGKGSSAPQILLQQEPRLATHMSRCKGLIELYENERDLYSETASSIFGKPLEECGDGSVYRKRTKVVILAVLYGMGSYTLAGLLGITPKEAQQLIDNLYDTYPELREWIKGNEKFVAKHKYVETLWGTRRRFKGVNFNQKFGYYASLTPEQKKARAALNRALRQSTNALVQGGAAMQTKQTMIACEKRLDKLNEARGTDHFKMLAQVHDEMLFTAPADVTREEVEEIRDAMVNTVKLIIPSKTDIAIGNCWGSLVDDSEWFGDGK